MNRAKQKLSMLMVVIIFSIFSQMFLASSIIYADGENLVQNGGFENYTVNWITSNSTITTTPLQKHSGRAGGRVTDRTEVWGSAQQWINIQDGKTYNFSAWVKLSSGSDKLFMMVDLYTADAKLQSVIVSNTVGTNWQQLSASYTFNIGKPINKAKLYISTQVTLLDYYIDDVECRDNSLPRPTATPSPTVAPVTVPNSNISPNYWDDAYKWSFDTTKNTAYLMNGWGVLNYSLSPSEIAGKTSLNFMKTDPQLATSDGLKINIDASKYKYIRISMKNQTPDTRAELYWATNNGQGFSSTKRVCFAVNPNDTGYTQYVFDLSSNVNWTGTITRLRFDPVTNPPLTADGCITGNVLLDYIAVSAPMSTTPSSGFKDITGNYAQQSIEYLTAKKAIAVGTSNLFYPNNNITNAEFIDMLAKGLKLRVQSSTNGFTNISSSDWFYNSVLATQQADIISGTVFPTNSYYTREQLAVTIINAYKYITKKNSLKYSLPEFSDNNYISPEAKDAVYTAYYLGFIKNSDSTTFSPSSMITKADAAYAIKKLLEWMDGELPNGKSMFLSSGVVGKYDLLDIQVPDPLNVSYANPNDPNEVQVDGLFTSPTGHQFTVPAFYDVFGDYAYDPRREMDFSVTRPRWKLRFTPNEIGDWSVSISIKGSGIQAGVLATSNFKVVSGSSAGFIRADSANPRFVYDNGKPFFGVGLNLCWPDAYNGGLGSGFMSYEQYYEKLVDSNGVNLVRLWMENSDNGIENRIAGTGNFDLEFSAQMDYLFLLSRQKGVKLIPTLKTFHYLSTTRWWENSVYNQFNGGAIDLPRDFFKNSSTITGYKNYLRYLVARYGAFDNIVSWQFMNEEDLVDGYNYVYATDVKAWHTQVTAYLKSIDPYNHLISTSFGSVLGKEDIYNQQDIATVNAHNYATDNWIGLILGNAKIKNKQYSKPSYFEEQGLKPEQLSTDTSGISLHNSLWASLVSGDTATAMTWWWDSYIKNNNLYYHYGAVSRLIQDLDWPQANASTLSPMVETAQSGNFSIPCGYNEERNLPIPYKTFDLDFTQNNFNLENDKIIYPRYFTSEGKTNYSPLTFNVNMKNAGKFEVVLMGIPYGNSSATNLSITVDGVSLLNATVPVISGFSSTYSVDVPAGAHTVVMGNTGNADITLGDIRFTNNVPKIVAYGAMGSGQGIFWLHDRGYEWLDAYNGYTPTDVVDAVITLPILQVGKYEVTWWDTWTGTEISKTILNVQGGETIKLLAPTFKKDIALKIKRISTKLDPLPDPITNLPISKLNNLALNPGFENGQTSWGAVNCTMNNVSNVVYSGASAILATNRTDTYSGPQQFLSGVANNKTYYYSVKIKKAIGDPEKVHFVFDCRGDASYRSVISMPAVTINSDGWTQISGVKSLALPQNITQIKIYVETATLSDMYYDDFELSEIPLSQITETSPQNNSKNVLVDSDLILTFNNDVDLSTLTGNVLINGSNLSVQSVSYCLESRKSCIVRLKRLELDTNYTVSISGVKDYYGFNVQPMTFSFKTNYYNVLATPPNLSFVNENDIPYVNTINYNDLVYGKLTGDVEYNCKLVLVTYKNSVISNVITKNIDGQTPIKIGNAVASKPGDEIEYKLLLWSGFDSLYPKIPVKIISTNIGGAGF